MPLASRIPWLGGGAKRIAAKLGCSRNTVRGYLRRGGWQPYQAPKRTSKLQGLQDWLAQRFVQHRGNADVVRQDLMREHGIEVSLRTFERGRPPAPGSAGANHLHRAFRDPARSPVADRLRQPARAGGR